MGDSCSVCFGTRREEAKLYTTDLLDNNNSESTPEPKYIATDDEKVTSNPKRVTKDERSFNLEDKVSDTKNSREATLPNGTSECVLEDSKKSSSESQNTLERKDTNELVNFALQIPVPQYSGANERKEIIEDEQKYGPKMDTLLPKPNSDQPKMGRHIKTEPKTAKKGLHIKTDSELIHQMLYSSDSSDSFGCHQEESKNRL